MAMILLLTGCAGLNRDLSSCGASNFGSNWIVVQYGFDGAPFNCWSLHNTAIENEHATDGIYWKDTKDGDLVHISGWYNRVQVAGDWNKAASKVGIDLDLCDDGKYPADK